MRTQSKIVIVFFLISLTTVVLLSASVYFFINRYSFTDFYKRLEIRGVVTAKATLDHEEASQAVMQEVRALHLEKLPEEQEYFFKIEAGKTFAEEAEALGLPLSFFKTVVETGTATHQAAEIFFAGIRHSGKAGNYVVIVSAANHFGTQLVSYLGTILLIGILAASAFALFVSLVFSRQVFNPVKEITDRVKEISSQSLHLRLEQSRTNDVITELEITFNRMLDRLETAFETQHNFISNASHELSTPLTTIIGEAEVTLSKPRAEAEYTEALHTILHEAERLEKITKSLLFLAQTGFAGKVQKFDKVRVDQLLWDVKDTIDKINPKNKVQINTSLMPDSPEQLKIKGNEQLLHLALMNLVGNACKYSHNQPVTVSIGTAADRVILVIKDAGIGIPQSELKFIYDPFFRASNVKEYEGYGIGLPLTRNIVRLHDGDMQVLSELNKGTTVQLSFPLGHYTLG
ncbi:MAG: two-component sensor histidine kinase [Cyclobacteriaceae bacterium]|nr:two-component sensor histidine kinase [Cytophagales bacterium]MBX2901765.1 two-component sensor histidine kinase [Cyclobacteriaceae bacterium]